MKSFPITEKAVDAAFVLNGRKPFESQEKHSDCVRRCIKYADETPVRAVYDKGKNCIYCGESGRCPGWHAEKEIMCSITE